MKTSNLLRSAALASLSIIIFSCSKDAISKPETEIPSAKSQENTVSNPQGIVAIEAVDPGEETGAIQGAIVPLEAQYTVTVSNATFTSAETPTDEKGYFTVSEIPEGEYTLTIHSVNLDYKDFQINDIKVNKLEIVNLGVIKF